MLSSLCPYFKQTSLLTATERQIIGYRCWLTIGLANTRPQYHKLYSQMGESLRVCDVFYTSSTRLNANIHILASKL